MAGLDGQLKSAHQRVAARREAMFEAKRELLALVAQARGEGYTLGQLAETLGVSRGRAQELAKEAGSGAQVAPGVRSAGR